MAVVQKYFPDSPGDPRPQEPMSIWIRIDDVTSYDVKELGEFRAKLLDKVRRIAPPESRVTAGITCTDRLKNAFRFL